MRDHMLTEGIRVKLGNVDVKSQPENRFNMYIMHIDDEEKHSPVETIRSRVERNEQQGLDESNQYPSLHDEMHQSMYDGIRAAERYGTTSESQRRGHKTTK